LVLNYTFVKTKVNKCLLPSSNVFNKGMIEKLKANVELKFGRRVAYQKDCKQLADSILKETGEYISPATIRRVFGFLATNSKPSRVTLDILSRYIGLLDWTQFIELNQYSPHANEYSLARAWERMQEQSRAISLNTLSHIQRKSGIPFDKTITRELVEEGISDFLSSGKTATALIGPGGYGKSTVLAKWYLNSASRKKHLNDVILLISAQMLESLATDANMEYWLHKTLGVDPSAGLMSGFIAGNQVPPGRFILVIDALDEIAAQGSKLERIYSAVAGMTAKFSSTGWFKLIVSSRYASWNSFVPFMQNPEAWYNTDMSDFTYAGANMPPLSQPEIQGILDNTVNSKYSKRIMLEELHPEVRSTIAYPYYLQLFINVYSPESEYLLCDQLDLLREFLRKQVYLAPYAEEKMDILNAVIKLSDYGSHPENVRKNALRELYPVHLKLAGNYYLAYNDLLSFGLLSEVLYESQYGGLTRLVQITNPQLMVMLVAQRLLQKEGANFKLFRFVEQKFQNHEYLPPLINTMYQLVYKERAYEPLMHLFELTDDTLGRVFASPGIAITLRGDDYMRSILLPHYASSPRGRKYLTEQNKDINFLTTRFHHNLSLYLRHCRANSEELFANSLLAYSGFLSMDIVRIEKHYGLFRAVELHVDDDPGVAGFVYACRVLHKVIVEAGSPEAIIQQAISYCEGVSGAGDEAEVRFVEAFLPTLLLTDPAEYAGRFIRSRPAVFERQTSRQGKLWLYQLYQHARLGGEVDFPALRTIEKVYSTLNPLDSYQTLIIGEVAKSGYFVKQNNIPKAYQCFRNALEYSSIAGYKLIEVKLMKQVSAMLRSMGETQKADEIFGLANSLTEKTGFPFGRL